MSVEKWNYKMFNNPKIKYSCFIQSDSGDNICKMLRNDSPNNAIQEERAKLITAAPQMFEALKILRTYFGEHDKTITEHRLFSVADEAIKASLCQP